MMWPGFLLPLLFPLLLASATPAPSNSSGAPAGRGNFLCMVTVVRNEQPNLRLWIEHHRVNLGADLFYVIDDGSLDGLELELSRTPNVTFLRTDPRRGLRRQHASYEASVPHLKAAGCEWASFTDVDEYFVDISPTLTTYDNSSLKTFLFQQVPSDVAIVRVTHEFLTLIHTDRPGSWGFCQAITPGLNMVTQPAKYCKGKASGSFKYLARVSVDGFIPAVHTPRLEERSINAGWKILFLTDLHGLGALRFQIASISSESPCFDLFFKKVVPAGRIATGDLHLPNVTMRAAFARPPRRFDNETVDVLNRYVGCNPLPSKAAKVHAKHVHSVLIQQIEERVKPALRATRVREICEPSANVTCDPRYFWQCRCSRTQCLSGAGVHATGGGHLGPEFRKAEDLPEPVVCSSRCC